MASAPAWQPRTAARCWRAGAPRGANGLLSQPDTATSKEFLAAGGRWPATRRLLRRADFLAVYKTGMRRGSPHFTLFGRLRPAGAGDRYGITVTRKLGNAVVRNRLRRRTREWLRRLPEAVPACDFVIHPRPRAADGAMSPLAEELAAGLRRMRENLEKAAARPA